MAVAPNGRVASAEVEIIRDPVATTACHLEVRDNGPGVNGDKRVDGNGSGAAWASRIRAPGCRSCMAHVIDSS